MLGSLRWVAKSFRRTSMKDSNMAIPALEPGLAHSGSPTVLSTSREESVCSQSTGCEAEKQSRDQTSSMKQQRKDEQTQTIINT